MSGTWWPKNVTAYARRVARAFRLVATVVVALASASSRVNAQPAPSPPVVPAAQADATTPARSYPPAESSGWIPAKPAAPGPESGDRAWLKSVYEQFAASVVLIETETGTGSGFFFHSPRHVATALHVVDDAETIIVGMTDGRRWYGHVVAYSRAHDVALVELEQAVPDARLLVPFNGEIDIGESVAVIGHPFSGLDEQLPSLRATHRPVASDNKLDAWEWLLLPDGRIVKTDAIEHSHAHDAIGCQDPAWDVAGAACELALSAAERDALLAQLRDRAGLAFSPAKLAFYEVAYLAFRAGHAALAEQALTPWPDDARRFAQALRAGQRQRDS